MYNDIGCIKGVNVQEIDKFRPLRDNILVKRIEENNVTNGGIIIPDTAKEKPQAGIVMAIGSGARDKEGNLIPMEVSVGDRVIFTKWGGTEIKLDGEQYLIMKQSDILGIDYSASCSTSCDCCKGCC